MTKEELQNLFDKHYSLVEKQMELVNGRLDGLDTKMDEICKNHLSNLPQMEKDITKVTTNVEWLMNNHRVIATAAIGSIIASVCTLIFK